MAAGDEHVDVFALGKLHCDVHGIGHDGDVLIEGETPDDLQGRRAGRQRDRLALLYQRGRRASNPTLLLGKLFEMRLEGAVVFEGFVKEWLNRYGATVSSLQQTIAFELIQVSPDGHHRGAEFG